MVAASQRGGRANVRWIEVDGRGRVSLSDLEAVLGLGVDLLCFMAANNEVGNVYPICEAAKRATRSGTEILVDATQAAGRVDIQAHRWGIDYVVLSAHKLYGPKGVGALVAPDAQSATANLVCGHEGTPNVPGIVGFGEACRLRSFEMAEDECRIGALRDRLEARLRAAVPGLVVNGDLENRLSHNLHVSAVGAPNDAVVARLRRKVAISTGSACTSGAQGPSHVLRAMKLSKELQEGALRISLGKFNTVEEIDHAAAEIGQAIDAVRSAAGGN